MNRLRTLVSIALASLFLQAQAMDVTVGATEQEPTIPDPNEENNGEMGNKSLRLTGMAEVVAGGLELTFFRSGTFVLYVRDENGMVLFIGTVRAEANEVVFIPVAGTSEVSDKVNRVF